MNDCVYLFIGGCPRAIQKEKGEVTNCGTHCPVYISANSTEGDNMMEEKK